jgi:uncharacterized membrane protein
MKKKNGGFWFIVLCLGILILLVIKNWFLHENKRYALDDIIKEKESNVKLRKKRKRKKIEKKDIKKISSGNIVTDIRNLLTRSNKPNKK